MISSKILCALVTVFISIQTATGGIDCYECSSKRTGTCGEKFNSTNTPSRYCVAPGSLCGKMIMKSPEDFVIRGCVTRPEACFGPEISSCYTCDEDRCNLSSTVVPSFRFMLNIVSLAVAIWYF